MDNQFEIIEQHFGKIAGLIGERSRAIMLWNLLDGRAYTATELANCAAISRQACSNHLAKLVEGNLLTTESQGRHKYYRFANDKVAHVVENIAYLLPKEDFSGNGDQQKVEGIRKARSCYDHIAGKLGVDITKAMLDKEIIRLGDDNFLVTSQGELWFQLLEINIIELKQLKRRFAYPCLDWSERKMHLGGALGSAILKTFLHRDWLRRKDFTRELVVTAKGKMGVADCLKIEV